MCNCCEKQECNPSGLCDDCTEAVEQFMFDQGLSDDDWDSVPEKIQHIIIRLYREKEQHAV